MHALFEGCGRHHCQVQRAAQVDQVLLSHVADYISVGLVHFPFVVYYHSIILFLFFLLLFIVIIA
jgi:hypothetical protein